MKIGKNPASHKSGKKHHWWKGGEIKKICITCGNDFYVRKYREKSAKFCSYKCAGEWDREFRVGKKHPRWKGGTKLFYWKQARKIMAQKGINIKGLIIHHKNGKWKDNRFENLQAMTLSEHCKIHDKKLRYESKFEL